jgi:hypothetical protein
MYDYMDAKGKYIIEITIAAKCNAGATCYLFPRCNMPTLENKTEEYGYDETKVTFFVGDSTINPKEALGKHAIMYCTSPEDENSEMQGCQFAFKLKSWSRVK